MDQKTISAQHRTEMGKAAAARYRRAGQLPAVMYGSKGKAMPLLIDHHTFSQMFQQITESTILTLSLGNSEDEQFEAFVKDYQYDIVKDSIYHVDFYEVERGKVLRAKIQITLTGSPEGARFGGVLETGTTEIEVECLPKDLPERVLLDVSKLDLNESLRVSDLNLPDTVTVLTDAELTVAVLKFAKADTDEAESGAGEDTDAAGEVSAGDTAQ